MLSYYSVHGPIQTTASLWKKYQAKAQDLGLVVDRERFVFDRTQEVRQVQDNPLYAGMMEALDTSVGMVIDAIVESGQADNTVIIFTSDNGGVSSGDGYATSALPLRGGKGRQWEGGIRQPFYIHVPQITQGETSTTFASGTDFFPTILELAGDTSSHVDLDGRSLVPTLKGETLPDRQLFWHYPHYGNQGGEPSAILREGDWKLIRYFEDERFELYNLASDLGEQVDLASANPHRVEQMAKTLQAWLNSVNAKLPMSNTNYDAADHAASIRQAKEVRMQNREREHASYLQPEFTPNGGWWQNKGK